MKMRNLLIVALALLMTACTKVPAGYVGVKFNLYGSEKGVDNENVGPGKYWLGWNEEIYQYPTFTQTANYQELSFQSKEGLVATAAVDVQYYVDGAKANITFQKFRKDIDDISEVYLRSIVKDALVTAAAKLPIESLYGNGKVQLLTDATTAIRTQLAPFGIVIERINWASQIALPESVTTAVNAKIGATQKAQQRENEVAQAKAEAQKAIEDARGQAESKLLVAKAEAEAIRIRGDALKANQELVQLTLAEKWNGVLPQITGGAMPLLNMPMPK